MSSYGEIFSPASESDVGLGQLNTDLTVLEACDRAAGGLVKSRFGCFESRTAKSVADAECDIGATPDVGSPVIRFGAGSIEGVAPPGKDVLPSIV